MVGKNIKVIRSSANMTQDQLAEQLNVTRQAVSSWENGRTEPDIETLQKISEVLNVTVEELIYGEKKTITDVAKNTSVSIGKESIGMGAAIAIVISYVKWHSIGWAIFHGILGWAYVIYYVIKYGWQ